MRLYSNYCPKHEILLLPSAAPVVAAAERRIRFCPECDPKSALVAAHTEIASLKAEIIELKERLETYVGSAEHAEKGPLSPTHPDLRCVCGHTEFQHAAFHDNPCVSCVCEKFQPAKEQPEPTPLPQRAQILRIGHIAPIVAGGRKYLDGWEFDRTAEEQMTRDLWDGQIGTAYGWPAAELEYIARNSWIPIAWQRPQTGQQVQLLWKDGDYWRTDVYFVDSAIDVSAVQAWQPFRAPEPPEVSE